MDDFSEFNKRVARGFERQLEALGDDFMEIAEELNIGHDIARLSRIGQWHRLKVLERRVDGECFLKIADRNLLIAEWNFNSQKANHSLVAQGRDNFESSGKVASLDAKEITQVREWNEATHVERWVGFGIYVYVSAVAGESKGGEEDVYLFRLACEALGFLPHLSDESPDSNERSLFARKGADALHNKPDGSRMKRLKIRTIWASGKYDSRDICAEQECAALNMSFSSARKALINTPDPIR